MARHDYARLWFRRVGINVVLAAVARDPALMLETANDPGPVRLDGRTPSTAMRKYLHAARQRASVKNGARMA
jgi:hypothetical protein